MATLVPPVKIFASYSHDDSVIVSELIKFMGADVKRAGGHIWVDKEIIVGERWEDVIKKQLRTADIMLVFVSQAFLDDKRYTAQEIETALNRRKVEDIIIFPIILSPCNWQSREWLADTQVIPSKKTYQAYKGTARQEIALTITNQLIDQVKKINEARSGQEITFSTPIHGLLNRKALYYPLQLAEGHTITVELQAPINGADLELLSDNFTPIQQLHVDKAYVDHSCYGIFNYKVKSDGLYIIRVSKGIGEFILEVSDRPFGRIHGNIELNKTIKNTLVPRQFHRWLISLPANLKIRIEAKTNDRTADLELWAVDGPEAQLRERAKTDKFGDTFEDTWRYWNDFTYQTSQNGNYMVSVVSGDGTKYELTVQVVD